MNVTDVLTVQRLVACGICGGGIYTLIHLCRSIRKARAIPNWPQASGQIIESSTSGRHGADSLWIEAPKIAYRYLVDGQEYVGHSIALTEINTPLQSDAEDKIKPYPLGRQVAVFYDPQNPKDSYLQRESNPVAFAVFGIFGVALSAFGLLALLDVIHLAR